MQRITIVTRLWKIKYFLFWLVKYLLLCSHIEFEDSEEEAGDTVVTGGLKIGQARSFSMYMTL